jgi:hypothetical protein
MVNIDMSSIMSGQSYILLQEHFPASSYGQSLDKQPKENCNKENKQMTLNATKAEQIRDFGNLIRRVG